MARNVILDLPGYAPRLLFAGDYEVVGPDPSLGFDVVAGMGVGMILIHYHHRHEFQGGANKGLWGTVCRGKGVPYQWEELDRVVASARKKFPVVGLYPIGWAHMIPRHHGETVLDVDPNEVGKWVSEVVERYQDQVDIFPIFYELNVFDLFFRVTHGHAYGQQEKRHIIECLIASLDRVRERCGEAAVDKLTAATFVELTQSAFYWMSEGKLLELPRGSALLEAPLSPMDLIASAKELDVIHGGDRYARDVKRLLARLIFWNADDSGAGNTVGDDMHRIYRAGMIHEPTQYPDGFVHSLICGWDAQPQNTYEYLLKRLMPDFIVPSSAAQLERNWEGFKKFIADPAIPESIRKKVRAFVLDDVFKCTKQSGITSAVYPYEHVLENGGRHGGVPISISDIGQRYIQIIDAHEAPQREEGEINERSA